MEKQPVKSKLNSLIFQISGHNVVLDSDLAKLYDTVTKKLKQQVRRNIDRFPEDFMFELSESEKKINISFKLLLKKIDELKPVLPQGSRKTVGFKRKNQS